MDRKNRSSLLIFVLLMAIISMDVAVILPNQVLIAAELGIDFAMVGLMIGLYVFIAGVSTLVFGYLTDLTSRKRLLLFAGFLWSISNMFHVIAQDFWLLFLFRVLAAVATGVTNPVLFSYLSDVISPDSRSKPFAYWGMVYIISTTIAGIMALMFNQIPTNLIDVEAGGISERIAFISENYANLLHTWRYPFLIIGILGLTVSILAVFVAKEPMRAGTEKVFEDLATEDVQYSYRIKISDIKYIFKKKSNFFLIMNFFDVIGQGVLFTFIFPLITLEMGVAPTDLEGILFLIVLAIFVFVIGMVLAQFFISAWADKKVQRGNESARVKVALMCTILKMPIGLCAYLMSPNVPNKTYFGPFFGAMQVNSIVFWILWFVFSVLLGFSFALGSGIGPNWRGALMDINLNEHRGTMVAVASFVDQIGQAIGAIIGGIAILVFNSIFEAIFWVSLSAGLVSVCLWLPLLFTYDKDLAELNQLMAERAEKMKKSLPDRGTSGTIEQQ